MNKYVDEKIINYKRPIVPLNRRVSAKKGNPLTQKVHKKGILVGALRCVAAIFLLVLSTLSGDSLGKKGGADINVERIFKKLFTYGAAALALWGVLAVLGKIINAVALLPTWSLILVFAVTVLGTASILKDN